MANLKTDDQGRPVPQAWNPALNNGQGDYEGLQSTAGSMNVRIKEGDAPVLGATTDAAGANSIMGKIKALVAALPAALSTAGNLCVKVAEALPTGSNVIGKVDINSAIPAGTNNIGLVTLAAGTNVAGTVNAQTVTANLTLAASAARNTNGQGTDQAVAVYESGLFFINVTAIGAGVTLQVNILSKDPVGNVYAVIGQSANITATGCYVIDLTGKGLGANIAASWTITGGSVTFSVSGVIK